MCMQCVGQGAPYVVMSLGVLRAMAWRAKSERLGGRSGDGGSPVAGAVTDAPSTVPQG